VLTKEAVIVTPVTGRPVPETDTTVFGTTTRNSSVQQITIAVDEDDVPTVTEAVAAGLTIQCVAISGVPPGEKANEPPEGMVAVPVSGRTVSANSRVTRDDLIDPRTGKRRFVHLPAETLEQRHIIADPHALPGRVLRDDKPAGEIFLIEDLAPPGTAEGLAGALPPGRRSFALEATRLAGAHQLRRGDHVDILASLDLKLPSSVRSFQVIPGRTEIRVIVQDAIVLAPLGARDALAISEDSEPALQLILGIRPEEVSVLTQALSRDAGLRAVFRSRRDAPSTRAQSVAVREPSPGDHNAEHDPNAEHDRNGDRDGNADTTSIPDLASLDDAKLMVTQVGNERQTWVFLPDESAPLNGFGQTVDHGALPDEAAPDEAAPVKAAPVKAAPVKAAPDDTAPVKAAPVKTAQGDAAQGGALPDRSRDKTARTRSPAQSWESGYVP